MDYTLFEKMNDKKIYFFLFSFSGKEKKFKEHQTRNSFPTNRLEQVKLGLDLQLSTVTVPGGRTNQLWLDLQFNMDSEKQIFIYSSSFWQKSAVDISEDIYFFHIFILMSDERGLYV